MSKSRKLLKSIGQIRAKDRFQWS